MFSTTVTHKFTGEQITFIENTTEKTVIEVTLPPNGDGPPLHKHDQFEEHFEVLEGELTLFSSKKKKSVLQVGETHLVRLKQAHTFTNDSNQPVKFRVTLTPQCDFETSVRIHYGLMDDGLTDDKGNPKEFAYLAVILAYQNTWLANVPIGLQRFLVNRIIKKAEKAGKLEALKKYYVK